MDWKDKIIVIVGADNPVGNALCNIFSSENARVYACTESDSSLRPPKIPETVSIQSVSTDDPEALSSWITSIGEKEHCIDTVFCDIRTDEPGLIPTELTPEIADKALRKTTYTAWKAALYSVPYLEQSSHGSVVFITDNSVRHPKKDNILTALCSTSIESITKNFSSEVAARGIRMCSVAVDHDTAPEDAAGCAAFLASSDASYITGTMIETSGSNRNRNGGLVQ